ncbi:MAG: hypothetical protein ACOC4C_00970 [Fibrobacterota bacterium]
MVVRNAFSPFGRHLPPEILEPLRTSCSVRIEDVFSCTNGPPENFWRDCGVDEWVILLTGAARLLFAEPARVVGLNPGDFIHIPAHTLYRVQWTAPSIQSVWLAVAV